MDSIRCRARRLVAWGRWSKGKKDRYVGNAMHILVALLSCSRCSRTFFQFWRISLFFLVLVNSNKALYFQGRSVESIIIMQKRSVSAFRLLQRERKQARFVFGVRRSTMWPDYLIQMIQSRDTWFGRRIVHGIYRASCGSQISQRALTYLDTIELKCFWLIGLLQVDSFFSLGQPCL